MSEPSRGQSIRKEIRKLTFLVSDLEKTIDRLENLIESSDEESSVDTDQLQCYGIQKGTVVTIARESRKPLSLGKHAIVLDLTSPLYSLVKSPHNPKAVDIENTKLRVASITRAARFRDREASL